MCWIVPNERDIEMRLIIAFLVAPVSFGLLAILLSVMTSSASEGLWVFQFSALVGYPVAAGLGVPTFLLFKKLKWEGLLPYGVASVFFSFALVGYFIIRPMVSSGGLISTELLSSPRLLQIGFLMFATTFSVLVFWLIARPDRNA
jgi:hypothetical protein